MRPPRKGLNGYEKSVIQQVMDGSFWGNDVALLRAQREEPLPQGGGLYAISLQGELGLLYIGQTSNFARRINNELVRGLEGTKMPNAEHYTAAPGLWYILLLHQSLRIACAPLAVAEWWRKGLESLALAVSRRVYRGSPLLNYTRMPTPLLRKPPRRMGNSTKSLGKRVKSAPSGETRSKRTGVKIQDVGLSPQCDLLDSRIRDPFAENWGGYDWSPWLCFEQFRGERAVTPATYGFYGIWRQDDSSLAYIGHGFLRKAVLDFSQRVFRGDVSTTMSCSYIPTTFHKNQCEEARDDLPGAHLIWNDRLPVFQFRSVQSA